MKLSMSVFSLSLIGILAFNPLYAAKTSVPAVDRGSLATVAAIDKNEVLVSVLAANKKDSSDVADFAKMMIEQHGENLTQILELSNKLNALPLNGGSAEKITAQGKQEMTSLGGLQGEQFDKAYADAMVKGHQNALTILDTQLIKTAKTPEIKKFLTDTRDVVAKHLEHAKKLQADLHG